MEELKTNKNESSFGGAQKMHPQKPKKTNNNVASKVFQKVKNNNQKVKPQNKVDKNKVKPQQSKVNNIKLNKPQQKKVNNNQNKNNANIKNANKTEQKVKNNNKTNLKQNKKEENKKAVVTLKPTQKTKTTQKQNVNTKVNANKNQKANKKVNINANTILKTINNNKTENKNSNKNFKIQNLIKRNETKMENLKISFLGGVSEIGKNMTVLEYGQDMIVIDCGMSFPDEDLPGVDSVVQDITYLVENKDRLRGIFITHGHEDHIGAVNYVLDNVKAPIYGSRVSLGLIENKLRESKKTNVILKSVKAGTVVVAGSFKVEFIPMTHSIPGAMAMAITTPAGTVVHSGDFKIDFTPIGNEFCDLKRLADIGKQGVTLLMCESTNVEREGFSMSESVVGKTFDELFGKLRNERIIIATFASNIHRLQQILDLAAKYKRKIAFTGRSMVNVSDMAIKLGELKCDRELIIDIDKVDKYEDKELIIISTGSQGESMSALTRMASDNFPKVKLNSNDAVIISAAPIPGNEKAINTVINNLYRKDCKVIYNELADVHASGHAYKEELKILHSLLKPKFFIPVHGEYRHLKNHQNLAQELGMKARNIVIPEIGMQVEVGRDVIKVVGTVPAGEVLIDGTGLGDKDSNVIRDRLMLSEDGVCAVVVPISVTSRQVTALPNIISRGFVYQDEANDIISEAKEAIFKGLNNLDLKPMDQSELIGAVRKVSTNFFFKKTKRKPVILSIIVDAE